MERLSKGTMRAVGAHAGSDKAHPHVSARTRAHHPLLVQAPPALLAPR